MSLVVDPSLAFGWFFEDERNAESDAVLDEVVTGGAIVPTLWRLEIANGFQVAIRRGRIDAVFRDHALAQLASMPITVDSETDVQAWAAILRLSDRFQLTAYDAAYLELAQRRDLPLATRDRKLRIAAEEARVAVWGDSH